MTMLPFVIILLMKPHDSLPHVNPNFGKDSAKNPIASLIPKPLDNHVRAYNTWWCGSTRSCDTYIKGITIYPLCYNFLTYYQDSIDDEMLYISTSKV